MLGISQKAAKVDLLAEYNKFLTSMENSAAAYFEKYGHKVDKKRPYILDSRDDWQNNIILPEVVKLINEQGCKLHQWIHNGLSSQAMLFNLIGPLVVENNYEPLFEVLRSKNIQLPIDKSEGYFEYEDYTILREDKNHPTSIDFVLKIDSRPVLFIEAKFKEREFGGCSKYDDCDCNKQNPLNNSGECFYNRYGMKYWDLIRKHNLFDNEFQSSDECPLAKHYQFYREVLFAVEHDAYFVLLYDNRNPFFVYNHSSGNPGIFTRLHSRLPDNIREKVSAISIQKLFGLIREDAVDSAWIEKFEEKYGM